MIELVENKLYRVEKLDDYEDVVFRITMKETDRYIDVYKCELQGLLCFLEHADNILK